MKTSNLWIVGVATALALIAGCSQNTPDGVTILDYGLYDAVALVSGSLVLGQKPTLVSVDVIGHREATTTIPCQPNTYFGLRLDPATLPSSYRVRYEHEHPPFTDQDKKTLDITEVEVNSKDDFDGEVIWCFLDEFPEELVAGPWTTRVFIEDKLVAEKKFQIVK